MHTYVNYRLRVSKHAILFIVSLFILIISPAQKVSVICTGSSFQKLSLARYSGDKILNLDDVLTINTIVTFSKMCQQSGMYYIFTDDSVVCEFIYDKDFPGSITLKFNNYGQIELITGPKPTVDYWEYKMLVDSINDEKHILLQKMESLKEQKEKEVCNEQVAMLTQELMQLQEKYSSIEPNCLMNKYLLANRNVGLVGENTPVNNEDTLAPRRSLEYFSKHYLENVDLANSGLLNTPVITTKVNRYFGVILPRKKESFTNGINYIISNCKENTSNRMFLVHYMLKYFSKRQNDILFEYAYLYLIKEYILNEPDLYSNKDLMLLQKEYDEKILLSLGYKAPELELATHNGKKFNLNKLESDYTILYFYAHDCGLCYKVTGELRELIKRYNYLNVPVVAVYVGDDYNKWLTYLVQQNISHWNNIWDADKITQVIENFDLATTPTMYLLDSEKKIINKNFNIGHLEEFLYEVAME